MTRLPALDGIQEPVQADNESLEGIVNRNGIRGYRRDAQWGRRRTDASTSATSCRYPSDLTDEEWSVLEPLIPLAKRGARPRKVDCGG